MADNLKGFSEETLRRAANVKDAIKEIKEQTRDLNNELRKIGGPLSDVESYYNNISNLSKKLLDTQNKSLISSKGTKDAWLKQNEARIQARALDIQILNLINQKQVGQDKMNSLLDRQIHSLSEAKDQAKILTEEYGKLVESSASLDRRTKFFSKGAEWVKEVKGLKAFAGPFEAAAKASREQVIQNQKALFLEEKIAELKKDTTSRDDKRKIAAEIRQLQQQEGKNYKEILAGKGKAGAAGAKAGIESIMGGIGDFLAGPIWITALIEAFKFIKDAMFAADERTTKLAKGLMISKDAARAIYSSFTNSKSEIDSIYRTTKDITEAFTDLTELTEFVTVSSMKMVEAQIILTKNLGLSKEQAFGVQEAFANSNIEADEGTDIIYDQIAAFANQNKLVSTGKAIFNDIAKTSKLIQVNFKGNLGALTKTTLEAKKLGLTLDQVSKAGSSLLNFEESISAELEAELLTGKDINLEKARAYALNHDIAGLAKEISRQGFTQEEFANYNVIQQEAIAKAYGMQAEEMADMLYKAKVLDKVGGQTLKNMRERADVLEREGKETEAINLRNTIAQLEQGILSGKTLKQAEKANTAQEKFNQSLEQAKEVFTDFVTGESLDKFADLLTRFVESVNMKGFLRTLTGGFVDDEDIAKKRLGEQTKKLSTETDNDKRKQIQENINKLQAEIVEIQKEKKEKFREEAETDSTGTKMKVLRAQEAGYMATGMEEKFAKGGIIVKPIRNATMGEAGPEAVIPLHRLPEMLNANSTNDEAMNKMIALLSQQNTLLAGIKDKKSYIGINGTVFGTTQENNSFVVS
jgi:hypothetical protein